MIGRDLYRRSSGGVTSTGRAYEVDTLTVTLYRPMRGRWTFGVGVDVDLDPAESQVSLTLAFWRLVVWWSRP